MGYSMSRGKGRATFAFTALVVCVICLVNTGRAQDEDYKGSIKGRVLERATKLPIPGATVLVAGTSRGASADADGSFVIKNLPAGEYVLRFSCIGYEPVSVTDVVVRSGRITFVETELVKANIETESIKVSGGYFAKTDEHQASAVSYSSEEIRRAPGAAGDVSRILAGLPSVAKVNDQVNHLIVRGGSPIENGIYIDNIEIPNINHFPRQGTSGGSIGLLNVDLIKDVTFSTGGFAPSFGDRLSSVMDISLREGNRDEYNSQLDVSMAGAGIVAEGPVASGKGSWLVSARRSYVDWLVKLMDFGVTPWYSDFQGKLTYDLNSRHRLVVLNVFAMDHNSPSKEDAEDLDFSVYGTEEHVQNTLGVNWRWLWGSAGYSTTSLSHTVTSYETDFNEARSDSLFERTNSLEQNFKLRNVNKLWLSEKHALEFGCDARHIVYDYDNLYASYTDALGNVTDELYIDDLVTANQLGAFASLILQPLERLQTTFGVRADYFSYSDNYSVSPRVTISYQLTDRTSLSATSGIYHQTLPLILMSQNAANRNLEDPVAYHYILGLNHLLTANTKLTVETYYKRYHNFPLDPAQGALFVLDELFYRGGSYYSHGPLCDDGEAYSTGIEVTVQKKLATNFYGLVGGSYFRSRCKDLEGIWRNRVFDNRAIFNVEGGYKPNEKWKYSARWVYAGGPPYTPFDTEASRDLNRAVLDDTRINALRHADYHSLSVRVDRRFMFRQSSLIVYLSIWNAYNRKNIASYFWNEFENEPDTEYQWGLMPIFGLEWEF